MPPQPEFTRVLIRVDDENRLLIRSSCTRCGESRLVSQLDGSMDEWETQHSCEDGQSIPPSRPREQ